jgi:hypothetical protein
MGSRVEVAMTNGGWGGDLVLTPTGDLALLQDTAQAAPATAQWVARLILTTPILFDSSGNRISRADDMFNETFGAGVRALIGQPISPSLLNGIKSRILNAMAQNPEIAQNPPPPVNVSDMGNGFVLIQGDSSGNICYTVTGQAVPFPATPLQIIGAS